MTCGDFQDLNRRIAANKSLRNKAFIIAKNPKYASMIYNVFDKKSSGGTIKNEIISNNKLTEELHKLIIRKFN